MRTSGQRRRVFLGVLAGLGGLSVGADGSPRQADGHGPAVAAARPSGLQSSCTPGHTDGDRACTQIRHDAGTLTPFDATATDLLTRFAYPCGWTVRTSTYDDRIQANASRSDIGEAAASVDVQVRNYTDPVTEGFLDEKRSDGDYDDVSYRYAGRPRTGIVTSPATAEFGTVAHAVVPPLEGDGLRHVEFTSSMHGADCASPRPDYRVVRAMLATIEPNRAPATVTVEDQSVSSEVTTQAVVVSSVTLPDGGFVVLHSTPVRGSDLAASVIGASSYLSRGSHRNIRIALDSTISDPTEVVAMPHLDTDGDSVYEFGESGFAGDGPYSTGTGPVTDRATVSPVTDTPVPDDEGSATRTGRPPSGSSATSTSTRANNGTTEGGGAGLGVVGTLSGLALAGAGWIRRHRRDGDR